MPVKASRVPPAHLSEPQARSIQNYGEQHPYFRSEEMRAWRREWNRPSVSYADIAEIPEDVCRSSLGEDLKPIDPSNTAHVWDEGKSPVTCAECGAERL